MNRKIYVKVLLILCIIFLMPKNVMAAKIASSRMGNIDSVTVGKSITIPFYIDLSGVDKTSNSSFGIFMAGFELIFDDDIFSITNVKSTGFDSQIYTENGEYAVISTINTDYTDNTCVDDILYCGEYEVLVTFTATDTNEESTIIKMGDVMVSGFELVNGVHPTYNLDDMLELTDTSNKSRTITINKSDEVIIEEPKSIIKSKKPEIDNKVVSNTINEKKNEQNTDSNKSSNNYLSKLDVKGYILDFYKRTNEYDLEIEEGVNSLLIETELEDKKATLEIVGADDLKNNNYKVKVNVKAENGSIRTYIINVSYLKDHKQKKLTSTLIVDKIKKIYNDYKLYILVGGIVLLLIILISIIVNKVNDKKLGNKFDNF